MKRNFKVMQLMAVLIMGFSSHSWSQKSISSWSGQVFDPSQSPLIYTPRTVEQVVQIIKKASAEKKKVRFSGAKHSWNSIILADNSTYISMVNLNKIGAIEKSKTQQMTITVESGVMLGTLSDYLFEKGYSLGFAMPEFRGLTIGGLLATGSHGSSRRHIGVSHQIVESLQLVTAEGKILELTKADADLFKAATVGLGVVGAVTKIKLQIVPRFNVKMTSSVMDLTQNSLVDFLKAKPQEDFLFIMWFPKLKKAILESGVMTTEKAELGAENIIFGQHLGTTEVDYATANILAKGRNDVSGAIESAIEAKRFEGLVQKPRFVVEENGFDVQKSVVVGPANKMLIARGNDITWPYKLSDYSFSFPLSKLQEIMNKIEKFSVEKNYSFPNAGISLRFVKTDRGQSSFISTFQDKNYSDALFVSAEFLEYRAFDQKGLTETPRDPLKYELLKILSEEFNVQFHLGKNDDVILKNQKSYSGTQENYSQFLKTSQILDPDGIFRTQFVDELLKQRSQ